MSRTIAILANPGHSAAGELAEEAAAWVTELGHHARMLLIGEPGHRRADGGEVPLSGRELAGVDLSARAQRLEEGELGGIEGRNRAIRATHRHGGYREPVIGIAP